MRMAYTLCRVVVLAMNDVDQAEPGSCRVVKGSTVLTKRDILCRLRHEYADVVREVRASKWKPTKE